MKALLDHAALAHLLSTLVHRGYALVGPTVVGTAINYQRISTIADLPEGWKTEQSAARYRLARGDDERLFAYGPAVESLKRYLRPPLERLWSATRSNGSLRFEPVMEDAPKLAIVGVRPCDLAAVARLDDVFLRGPEPDASYRARRAGLFLVAANCTETVGTCFCASMGAGPAASPPFDLAFTELPHRRFVVEIGSDGGREMIAALHPPEATADDLGEERRALAQAAETMTRSVDADALAASLPAAFDRTGWQEVARRCLACANCTLVCPTCFCHTIDDRTSLAGDRVERERRWDSCFGADFSYIHGGSIRSSVASRYRQWATHKFASWTEQFGTPGCVGCGRCITWCPAGIDVTEEVRRITGA